MVTCLRRERLRPQTGASAAEDLRRVRAANGSVGKLSAADVSATCHDSPRRAVLPLGDRLSLHLRREPEHGPVAEPAQAPVEAPASEAAPVSHTNRWHGRLRSSSTVALAQTAEEGRGGSASAAAASSSGARSSGDSAVPAPYVEHLFIPVVRLRAPVHRKRKCP